MAIPSINKVKDILDKPFRITGIGKPIIKSNYAYYVANNEAIFAKYTDDTKTDVERYDKKSKKWVTDEFKNYWYKEKNTAGKEVNKNYLEEYQSYTIEFKDTVGLDCYNGDTKKQEKVIGKRFFIQIRGTEKFGTAKKLIDAMNSAEALDNKYTDVWYKMEQDGIAYKFSPVGKVPAELLATKEEETTEKKSIIDEVIKEFQADSSKTRQDIMSALINTYGFDPFDAGEILNKHFKDRL